MISNFSEQISHCHFTVNISSKVKSTELLSSVSEQALMHRYCHTDGRIGRWWEGWVGFPYNACGFTGALCKESVQDGGKRDTDDLCSCIHCPL